MHTGGQYSRRKVYFQMVLALGIFVLVGFVLLKAYTIVLDRKIVEQRAVLETQRVLEDSYKAMTGYNKLQAVKVLETEKADIPRSEHINKVIQMLEDLKAVQSSDSVLLSDFKVDLHRVSLKGQVANLLLLYYSNPQKNIISLLDRFSSLDFIQDIRIQTYNKMADTGAFEFVLEANVVNDGTSK